MFLMLKPEREEIYEKTSLSNAINKIYDATVLIETYSGSVRKNIGTGFFYKKDDKYGYILTNQHVISEGVDIEIVTSKDERVKIIPAIKFLRTKLTGALYTKASLGT